MKGIKIFRAKPSNAIDIFALLKNAVQEGVYPGQNPTKRQLQSFYLTQLLQNQLPSPFHFYYLAQRGRGFLGYLHAAAIPNYWDSSFDSMFIEMLYIKEKYRRKGVAKKLLELFHKDIENIGVTKIDLLAKDHNLKYWSKQKAEKITNMMRINL